MLYSNSEGNIPGAKTIPFPNTALANRNISSFSRQLFSITSKSAGFVTTTKQQEIKYKAVFCNLSNNI